MANAEELRCALEGLKHGGHRWARARHLVALAHNALGRCCRAEEAPGHLRELERELLASALRLAAKANLLCEILDVSARLHTLEALKRVHDARPVAAAKRVLACVRRVIGRRGGPTKQCEHLRQLERELLASALRLAAKANLLSEILDAAHRLGCAHLMGEAQELAATLVEVGEVMEKALDETAAWRASREQAKRAAAVIREASDLPKVDEFLVVLHARLAGIERCRSLSCCRPRSVSDAMALCTELDMRVSDRAIVLTPTRGGSSLVIDRSQPLDRLSLTSQPPEVPGAVRRAAYGVVGFVTTLAGAHVVVVTRRTAVGDVPRRLWRADAFDVVCVAPPSQRPALTEQQRADEERYMALVREMLAVRSMYYADDWDATLCAQAAASLTAEQRQAPLWQRADTRFFWNRALVQPLIDAQADAWVVPFFLGFAGRKEVELGGRRFALGLVSRRSRFRAGTRLFMRGVDAMGCTANFVETEQLALGPDGAVASLVQIRGSIPVFWEQLPNLQYKPRPTLTQPSAVSAEAFKTHFEELLEKYGRVTCVNLVDHKGGELVLANEYDSQVRRLGNDNIHYVAFDFHKECKKSTARLSILVDNLRKDLDDFGFYYAGADGKQAQSQTGSFRTNCVDNLDRTNVVQGLLAFESLEKQLRRMGVLAATANLAGNRQFDFIFKNLWADNADCISTQYSGTGALKTDITRTGKRTLMGMKADGTNSAMRYVLNNFYDGAKQDAYNLWLGLYHPSPSAPSPYAGAGSSTLAVMLVVAVVALFLAAVALVRYGPETGLLVRLAVAAAIVANFFGVVSIAKRNGRSLVNNPRLVARPSLPSTKKSD
eukprot:m51a1_g10075 putative phosphatidylinositide phosphatase sac1 (833) ;mRNA; r:31992-38864